MLAGILLLAALFTVYGLLRRGSTCQGCGGCTGACHSSESSETDHEM